MDKLPKIKSITKKLVVALLGAFLLLFLAFHMCANLFVLADDGGTAYSAFCHFMGTNVIVKVFEVVLMAAVLFHIVITVLLWFENRSARGTVRYHQPSATKTAVGSKFTIWSGILILCFLIVHFWGFYFVKLNISHPQGHTYMAEVEELSATLDKARNNPFLNIYMYSAQSSESVDGIVDDMEANLDMIAEQFEMSPSEAQSAFAEFKQAMPILDIFATAQENVSPDQKWIKNITPEQHKALKKAGVEVEPDFYHNVRYMFSREADANNQSGIISVVLYLAFFVILWFHLRHAFEAAFQTLGLTNYKYHRAIEVVGIAYAWIIVLGFASLPIVLYFL